jgi:methylated-DNA-protein-cysteine methyltransferase-like protein
MKNNTDFLDKVYEIVEQIPYGRVTSYGAIARHLGMAKSARLVGWAMSQSFLSQREIPAHRVVNRHGLLTGKHHFGGSTVMENLLRQEGIAVENDKIINFAKYFWDPSGHLSTNSKH